LKFFFIPNETKLHEQKVFLSIYDKNGVLIEPSPYKQITLIGEGTLPRIFFDKREIIMPVVPLGFESRVRFKIMNEGYDNTKLTYRWFCQNGPNLKVNFLDGEDIGMLKNEIKMELTFTSLKSISFTGSLTFIDSDNRESSIFVYGTADNSLFTSFPFQQKQYENLSIEEDDEGINLKMLHSELSDFGDFDDKKSVSHSVVSSVVTSTKAGNIIGYQRISTKVLNHTCKYLKKYLNLVLPPNLALNEFPQDLIRDNGETLYDFICIYTGKTIPFKTLQTEEDYSQRINNIRNQFQEIIRNLQMEGALLNTVVPEFLMDFKHYYKYIQNHPETDRLLQTNWQSNKKRLKRAWAYLNKEMWITLIYQILKIYYLSRVNLNSLKKSLKMLREDQASQAVSTRLKQSNIYSNSELILLRWIQTVFDGVYTGLHKKVLNFSEDFLDGKVLTSILLSYLPNIEEEFKLPKKKMIPENKYNISNEKILEILHEYGVHTHMKIEYLSFPTAREMLLFIIMMFQSMQHFIPKDTII